MYDAHVPSRAKLELAGVSSGYGAINIINALSLSVATGEIFALMGKNGMGKTTLLKTILGFVALRGGDVMLDGASIVGTSPAARPSAIGPCSPRRYSIPPSTIRRWLGV